MAGLEEKIYELGKGFREKNDLHLTRMEKDFSVKNDLMAL